MRGVIIEISRSNTKNKIVSMKKLIENGVFRIVFSLNPHSKLMWFILCLFLKLKFVIKVMMSRELIIKIATITRFIKIINFFFFLIGS